MNRNLVLRQWLTIFFTAFKLGCISFGGPMAHLAYFQEEYVHKKGWLSLQSYNELVTLAQFLPGPTSSQVGIAVGTLRAGVVGGIASFVGFTLPSVFLLIGFATVIEGSVFLPQGSIEGLKLAAVAIVAHILLGMMKSILTNPIHWLIAGMAFVVTLFWTAIIAQPLVIVLAMLIGMVTLKAKKTVVPSSELKFVLSPFFGLSCIIIFFICLFILPLAAKLSDASFVVMADQFFRSGSLVFGGGHVVLPLLERELVGLGYVSSEQFLAGYGATQAVPGPLFTFATYLGFVMNGWSGASIATIFIFLPSFLLIFGVLPFWNYLRRYRLVALAFYGASCAVVGILATAFINPIVTTSLYSLVHGLLTLLLFILLYRWKCPAWFTVVIGFVVGAIIF